LNLFIQKRTQIKYSNFKAINSRGSSFTLSDDPVKTDSPWATNFTLVTYQKHPQSAKEIKEKITLAIPTEIKPFWSDH